MVAYTGCMLDTWQDGEIRDVHQDMMRLTSQIVVKTLFGVDVTNGLEEVGAAFETTLEEVSKRFRRPFPIPDSLPTPGNLRYRKAVRRLDQLIYSIIQQRRTRNLDGGDLLSMLLHAQEDA